MDLGDVTQLTFVATSMLVFGRVGWSLARWIDRRGTGPSESAAELGERVRMLEDEHLALRQELAAMQERQDFTERALVRELPARAITPR